MDFENKNWWKYLDKDLQGLIRTTFLLVKEVESWKEPLHDYSFIVFPAAKAYEGYLKHLFLDMGFISRSRFMGKRFRIGKALNPSLDEKYRGKHSVYDKLYNFCKGPELADKLWDAWKRSRNILFHWFPEEKNTITFEESKERVELVINAIEISFQRCVNDLNRNDN